MSVVTKKNQWVIPQNIRDEFGVIAGESDVVAVKLKDGSYTFRVQNPNPLDRVSVIAIGKGMNLSSDEFLKVTRGDTE